MLSQRVPRAGDDDRATREQSPRPKGTRPKHCKRAAVTSTKEKGGNAKEAEI